MAYLLLVACLQVAVSPGLRFDVATNRDFGSFWASGDAANRGLDPYAAYELTRDVATPAGERTAVNLNPPSSVLLFQLLAHGDPAIELRVWQIVSAGLYVRMIWLLTRGSPARVRWERGLVLLAWEPLWSTLDLGQIYVFLMALATAAWLLMRRSPALAGVAIGLIVATKPQFLLWPVALIAGRRWRLALIALGTGLAVSLLPVMFGHGGWYVSWLHAALTGVTLAYIDNLSIVSVLTRAGLPNTVGVIIVGLGLAALFVFWSTRRGSDLWLSASATVAALLAGPVSWVGYATMLLPAVLQIGRWPDSVLLAAAILTIPGFVLQWLHWGFLTYDAALLLFGWALLTGSAELEARSSSLT